MHKYPKVRVAALRDGQPTKYRSLIDVEMYGDTSAVIGLAEEIKRWIRRDLPAATPAALASWLAQNAHAIAADKAADVCYSEIKEVITDIEKVINRPAPPRVLGPCPTQVDSSHDKDCDKQHPHTCALALTAKNDATQITCPRCRTTHDVEELLARQIRDTDDYNFSLTELHQTALPALREYVPLRTLQHWAASGRLQPRDHGPDGEPKYLLADVRRLREQKPQKAPTGAAARKKKKGEAR